MMADADIAAVGAALADRSRATILLTLLGGDALTAGELARVAGRSPSGASAHLRALSEAGLIVAEDVGRNRFFRLAGPDVGHALEALARVAPPQRVRTLRQSEAARALKRARTCYDHLAGELGMAVTDALVEHRILLDADGAFEVTTTGAAWLKGLAVDLDQLRRQRRALARACVDWTEHRPHLAGALGAAIADLFFARGWIERLPGGRAIALTGRGDAWLKRELLIHLR